MRTLAFLLAVSLLAASSPADDAIFRDATEKIGLGFVHDNGLSGEHWYPENFGGGAALVDYDGDGDLDVYLVQSGPLGPDASPASDRLYRNDLAAGRFVDVSERAGLRPHGYGMGVSAGDVDGDGVIDLYVTRFGSNQLLLGRGDGTLKDVTTTANVDDPRWSVPAVFFDYDRDGRLDLFVGNYVDFSFAQHRACFAESGLYDYCKPLVYDAVGDRLLRNLGDDGSGVRFEDVTVGAGLSAAFGRALGAVSADFNGDGRLDLYVANDASENQLWIGGEDGTFVDDALFAGAALNREGEAEGSMGVDAQDFDGDGDEDLFMTHPAGETNTLYENDGDGLFRDVTLERGLGGGFELTGFGLAWRDFDGDGRLDLYVVNGAVQAIEAQRNAEEEYPYRQRDQLFRLGSRYEETAVDDEPAVGRGVAVGDVDRDGDLDLLVVNNRGAARFLRNEAPMKPWIAVRATENGVDLLGATILVADGDRVASSRIRTEGSYASASDPTQTFGLAATNAEEIEIVRIDGKRRKIRGLPTGVRAEVRW